MHVILSFYFGHEFVFVGAYPPGPSRLHCIQCIEEAHCNGAKRSGAEGPTVRSLEPCVRTNIFCLSFVDIAAMWVGGGV